MRKPSRSNPSSPSCKQLPGANLRCSVSDNERTEGLAECASVRPPIQFKQDIERHGNRKNSGLQNQCYVSGDDSCIDINDNSPAHRKREVSKPSDNNQTHPLFEFYLSQSLLSTSSSSATQNLDDRQCQFQHQMIDSVIPNLRDISVSSCHPNIKPGQLYRAARPFSRNVNAIHDTLVKTLKIKTIIDLRDDNLTPIWEEDESRLLVSTFYKPTSITLETNKCREHVDASRESGPLEADNPTSQASKHQEKRLQNETILFDALKFALSDVPDDVLKEIAEDPYMKPFLNMIFRSEKRRLIIVNVLDSPAVRKRVLEALSGSPYLPLMALARAADKVTGLTAYAPFYFCKYVMSDRNIEESYIEMLHTCGGNFAIALKVICLSPSPILFHCSLGKDRTGLVAMLLLSVLGVSDSAIIFDYSLTSQANPKYHAYNRKFIVETSGLTEAFCEANAETMRCVLNHVRRTWGTVDAYLDSIHFTKKWRDALRLRFLIDPLPHCVREAVNDDDSCTQTQNHSDKVS